MSTASLKDFTPEYQQHIISSGPGLTNRKILSAWSKKFEPSRLNDVGQKHIMGKHVPKSDGYRFKWGDFASLSYTWGNPNQAKQKIVINRHELEVTSKLEDILQSLSGGPDFHDGYRIWIDALCINQQDLKERGSQVLKMRNIYSLAWSVVSWLGKDGPWIEKAFELAEKLSTYTDEENGKKLNEALWKDPEFLGTNCWMPFYYVLQNPYWSHCWVRTHNDIYYRKLTDHLKVIQELSMGGMGVILRYGNCTIDWNTFITGLGTIHRHLWASKTGALNHEWRLQGHQGDNWWNFQPLHRIWKDLRPMNEAEEEGKNRFNFEQLLEVSAQSITSDDRDLVYGLVGLMKSRLAENIQLDYSLDTRSVFTSIAKTEDPEDLKREAAFYLPRTFDLGLPQFKERGWEKFVEIGEFYFRWADWIRANGSFPIGSQALEEFFEPHDKIPSSASYEDCWEAYGSFIHVIQGRRFAISSKGYVGWVLESMYRGDDQQTKVGDLYCIIFGCSMPIILRECGGYYQVIGEGYLQGFMEGNAVELFENGEYEAKDFIIR